MILSVRSNAPNLKISARSNSSGNIVVGNSQSSSVSAYVNLIPHNITINQNQDPLLEQRVTDLEECNFVKTSNINW